MGLFSRKEKIVKEPCIICGADTDALKVLDGYLCKNCLEKCRVEIVASGKPIKKLTKNDILECIGGHPLLNKEEFLFVVVKDNKILFKKSGKKSNDKMIDVFEVSYSEIKSVSIEKEEEVIRRYTATRIALFGPFALAMKKKTVDKKEYLIVECKDFILSFKKNDNVCATIYKKLVIDPLEKIKTLKELLDMGAITEEEFNAKKKELLNL